MKTPPRKCGRPGCFVLIADGRFCTTHGGGTRPTPAARGYDSAWARRRAEFLNANPRCATCGGIATVADHIVTRRALVARGVIDPDAARYLQPLCASCHSRKTARQDGGFGN